MSRTVYGRRTTIGKCLLRATWRCLDTAQIRLIVEDSENSAATLEIAFLGIPGVSVRMASSALEALRILDGDGSGSRAIVTDLNMPRMDGFELIRRVRQHRKLSATPIIVVSADTDPNTPDRIAQLGVSAFFPKPLLARAGAP